MQENSATVARNDRGIIITDDYQNVVQVILSPERFRMLGEGAPNQRIVLFGARVVAPGVQSVEGPMRQGCLDVFYPVAAEKESAQRVFAGRGGPIAFHLFLSYPGTADNTGHMYAAIRQYTPPADRDLPDRLGPRRCHQCACQATAAQDARERATLTFMNDHDDGHCLILLCCPTAVPIITLCDRRCPRQ